MKALPAAGESAEAAKAATRRRAIGLKKGTNQGFSLERSQNVIPQIVPKGAAQPSLLVKIFDARGCSSSLQSNSWRRG